MLRYLTNKVEGNSCNEEEKEMSSSKYKTPNAKPSSVKLWACDVCKVTFPDYEQACRHEEACRQQEQNAQNAKEAARDTTTSFSQAKTMQRWSCDVCHEEFDDYDEACRHEKECAREKQQQRKQEEANSKGNAASKPVHPFFSGKEGVQGKEKNKKRSKQAETDAIEIQDDSEQVAPMPKKQKATKKQTEPTKKARSSRTEKSGDSTAASNKPQPNKKKKGNTQSTTPPLADIFGKRGASQIMAEHKAAEFAAKRRADAERERQRQKRRIEQHQQKLKESSEKAMQDAIQNKPLIPPEVRFPVPSHVVSNEDVVQDVDLAGSDTCWIDQDSLSKAQGRLEKTLRHSGSVEKATEEVEDCNPLLSTNAKPLVTQDALQNALSDLLAPPEKPLNSNSTEAWTDKYSIQNVPEDVCGADNKETAQELVKFVNEWKVERGKAHERRAEKQQALLKKKKKKRRYREDDIWEDSEEEDGLCSVCLLTGPSGSGKTNLVHAVARQSDCIVLEINTTERRGGTALKNAIEEATQSDSSLDMLKKNQMAVDADPLVDSDDEQEETAKKASSIIVVLIDEVDIIFEEEGDAGFWNAMSTLAKKAKCPIFLTANTVPESLLSSHIRYLHVETSLPRPEECVPKVKRILKKEGLHRRERFTESSAANKQLSLISQLCKCDLRRIVNELQLFATAPPRSGSEGDDPMKCESSTVDNASPSEYLGPTIRDISPREVSPHDLSLVTIRGKHFTPETSLEVYFGSQVSPAVKVLNDSTILAVCPPCSVAAGVTDSGVIERTGRESRTSRFAPVSIKVYAHGKVLSRSDAVEYTTNELCDGTPCSSIGGHWNIEYAFPPPRYGILGNQHVDSDDESIEAEFGSDERPRPVVPDPAPAVTTSQRTFTKEEAEAVLEKGISEWKAAHAESEASTETESGSARLMITPDGESSGGLDVLSTLTKVSSDAALLEDGLESGGIPFLAGVVPGFGSSLVNDVARNNTDTNDQKRRKLLRDANARPPNFERLYKLGWNEDGCFFGSSEAYTSYPSSTREKRLLSLSESLERGSACALSLSLVPLNEYDGNDDHEKEASDSLAETIKLHDAPRRLSEEDLFVRSYSTPSLLALPGDLRTHVLESGHTLMKQDALVSLPMAAEDKAHRLARLLSDLLEEDCDPSANRLLCELSRLSEATIVPLQDRMNGDIFLDYLPMLCNMALHERAEEHAFQQLRRVDPETAAEMTGRGGRTTRRSGKTLERRHYFVAIRSCSEDSVANEIGSELAKEVLHYDKK